MFLPLGDAFQGKKKSVWSPLIDRPKHPIHNSGTYRPITRSILMCRLPSENKESRNVSQPSKVYVEAQSNTNGTFKPFLNGHQYDSIIWSVAVPSYASMLLDPLSALVDTMYVGRLGSIPLGGVGLSNTIFGYFTFLFFFLVITTTSSVAAAAAGNDKTEISKVICHSIWIALAFGTLVSILIIVYAPSILYKVGAAPAMIPSAASYLRVRATAAPIILIFYVLSGAFRGLQDLKKSVYASVISNLVNLCLDPIFMFSMQLGVTGAALATAVSQAASTIVLFYFLVQQGHLKLSHFFPLPSRHEILTVLRPGLSISMRSIFDRSSFALATSKGASLGIHEAASVEIVKQIWVVVGTSWWPLGVAAQSLIANYWVARDGKQHMRILSYRILQWGLRISIIIALCVALSCHFLPRLFTNDPRVLHISPKLLLIAAFFMPFSAISNILDGILSAWRDYDYTAKAIMVASIVFGSP
ncbi:protein detoxification 44, chloroplastic [Galdieria sulphuraria]|nr:protein detoxification 44, chloroplastic [Galdieria sulphuraria]